MFYCKKFYSGLSFSLLSSCFFGILPWYVQFLKPLAGTEVFLYRVVFSLLPAFVLLVLAKNHREVLTIIKKPLILLGLLCTSSIAAIQWWIFVWAPLNHMTKEVSIGYFLLPLTLVVTGKIFFSETITRPQWLSIGFASLGVVTELVINHSISWIVIAIAGFYPIYFLIRSKLKVSSLAGFFIETCIMFLVSFFIILVKPEYNIFVSFIKKKLILALIGLGLISVCAFACFITASRNLPFVLFGLLSYLEPVVIFLVAVFLLKQPIPVPEYLTFSFIYLSIFVTVIDTFRKMKARA